MNIGSVSPERPVLVTADCRIIPASNAIAVRVGPASNKIAWNERAFAQSKKSLNGLSDKGTMIAFAFAESLGNLFLENR